MNTNTLVRVQGLYTASGMIHFATQEEDGRYRLLCTGRILAAVPMNCRVGCQRCEKRAAK